MLKTANKPSITYGQPGSMEYILRSLVSKSIDGVVKLAPGIAKRILEDLNFPGQRKIDAARVYSHARNIKEGDWLESFCIDFVALPDGRIWNVDGQHRLTAISNWSAPVDVTIRMVECDTEKEARLVYAGYDQRKSVRTNSQILDAIGIAEELGLSRAMANCVFSAAPLLMNNLEPMIGTVNATRNPELFMQNARLEALENWAKEAIKYEEIIKKAKKSLLVKMRQAGIVAVALYTLREQPEKATEFWTGVAENDGLRKDDPRNSLITDMLTRKVGVGNARQKVQQPAVAWNAWYEGRRLSQIKCLVGAPLVLLGTNLKAAKK